MSIDGRSRLGRRVADLCEDFAQRLGGWASLSDTMIASIRRAAELNALAEEVRTHALNSGDIDPIGVVRLEGAAARATRALMLDRPREPEPMTLEQHAAHVGRVLEHLVEYGSQIAGGGTDDLEHFGRCSLLLEGFFEIAGLGLHLVEQLYVLDCDDSLVGEGLEELDLLFAERASDEAEQADDAEGLPIPNERYAEYRPKAH